MSSFTEWKTEKFNFPVFKCLLKLSRCGHLVLYPHPQSHCSSVSTVLLPSTLNMDCMCEAYAGLCDLPEVSPESDEFASRKNDINVQMQSLEFSSWY